MQLNIIHLSNRRDRLKALEQQLNTQNISDYKIWDGIIDKNVPARGIARAHKQIVKYAKEKELSEILIAEDDLKFTAEGAFDYFLRNKPDNFDLYLASIYLGEIKNDNTVEDFSGLTFYIVSERFYNTFLSKPEYDNLDRLLRYSGKFVVCDPFTVIQHNGYSDNQQHYCNYDSYLENRRLFG